MVTQSGLFIENDSPKEAWSPSQKLEDAVAKLQRDITDYRKELRIARGTRSGDSSSAYEKVGVYFHASSQIFGKI